MTDVDASRDRLPELHDWEITSLSVDRFEDRASIVLVSPERQVCTISLGGVTNVFASDFKMQNVVYDVMLLDVSDQSDAAVQCRKLLDMEQRGVDKDVMLLLVEPSWGCEFAAAFTTISWSMSAPTAGR
jgi:hypothetical protein